MDNFKIEVGCIGQEQFDLAMKLAFYNYKTASHYKMEDNKFTLFWTAVENDSTILPLPYKMDFKQAADLVWGWLQSRTSKQAGNSLNDSDVSEEMGFLVYNEDWGHVDDKWQAIIAIKPRLAWYGK